MSLRQDDRTRAGLVNLGSGALDLAALMDQSGSFVLENALAALKADASPSTSQAPKFQVAKMMLADVPTPGQTIVGPWLLTIQGFEILMAAGQSACGSGASCSITENRHGCGPDEMCDGPKADSVTVAGNPGTIFTTTAISASITGNEVSIEITTTTYGEVHKVGTGAVIFRIEGTGTGHIDGVACPDASGVAKAHIEFTAKENYFIAADPAGGSAGYGLNQSYSADVSIKADDNANLAGLDISAKAHE